MIFKRLSSQRASHLKQGDIMKSHDNQKNFTEEELQNIYTWYQHFKYSTTFHLFSPDKRKKHRDLSQKIVKQLEEKGKKRNE